MMRGDGVQQALQALCITCYAELQPHRGLLHPFTALPQHAAGAGQYPVLLIGSALPHALGVTACGKIINGKNALFQSRQIRWRHEYGDAVDRLQLHAAGPDRGMR